MHRSCSDISHFEQIVAPDRILHIQVEFVGSTVLYVGVRALDERDRSRGPRHEDRIARIGKHQRNEGTLQSRRPIWIARNNLQGCEWWLRLRLLGEVTRVPIIVDSEASAEHHYRPIRQLPRKPQPRRNVTIRCLPQAWER